MEQRMDLEQERGDMRAIEKKQEEQLNHGNGKLGCDAHGGIVRASARLFILRTGPEWWM